MVVHTPFPEPFGQSSPELRSQIWNRLEAETDGGKPMTEEARKRLGVAFSMLSFAAVTALLGLIFSVDRIYYFTVPFGLMGLYSVGSLWLSTLNGAQSESTS